MNSDADMGITQIPGYTFYRYLDCPGNDIGRFDQNDLSVLQAECEKYDYCMGFNTLGWIKYSVDASKLRPLYGAINYNDGIYVRNMEAIIQSRITKLISIKNDPDKINKTYDITFTITTCKRLDLFKRTIDTLLINYSNFDIIREFICIDDNSSTKDREEMIKRYPFFTFIMKTESQKGHQKSMNMLYDVIKTKYNIHFEDDWYCNKPFDFQMILNYVIKNNLNILILRKICWADTKIKDYINEEPVREYVYNGNHYLKPELNIEYDEETYPEKLNPSYQDRVFPPTDHWWWPGFSLNPSIINFKLIKTIGYFREDIPTELFEYDFALRCFYADIKTYYLNLNIEHIGTIVSSYTLNDMKRYYD